VADILGRHEQISGADSRNGVAAGEPSLLRILLGTQLRRLRESRGISPQAAARAIRGSESKISRIELGRNAIREIDVLDLLTLYSVATAEREQLLSLAEQANRPGWWHRYNDILPDWFQSYVGMEEAATSIRVYEPQFIPGLLQTPYYTAAVLAFCDIPIGEAERHVILRKERQRRFTEGRLKLWAIVEETALRRPLGGKEILRNQLRYLLSLCDRPNLTLQVIPSGVAAHAVPNGFAILRFAEADLPDVAYGTPHQRPLLRQEIRCRPLPAGHGTPVLTTPRERSACEASCEPVSPMRRSRSRMLPIAQKSSTPTTSCSASSTSSTTPTLSSSRARTAAFAASSPPPT
jgi:transcriptional regulator with XRE-family HTH domain